MKLAEEKRASAESGGLPCLQVVSDTVRSHMGTKYVVSPDEVGQCQRIQRLCSKPGNLVVADGAKLRLMGPCLKCGVACQSGILSAV